MIRQVGFEAMEARRLLAADGLQHDETAVEVAGDVAANASADIGNLDGSVVARSRLGWRNPYDRIGFSLERDAQFSVTISRFRSNVDLFVTDARGALVGYSMNRGRQADTVEAELEAGQYFVWSVARSWRSTRYRMELNANLVPPPPPTPEAEPTAPGDEMERLTEVAYFGGANEWGLNAVGAPESWAAGFTGEGITVAVIDTGVDLDHPDLAANIFVNAGEIAGNGIDDDGNGYVDDVHGYDFANRDADPNDVHGHGTHVAGTIAADDNGFGATGVAPDATILPIKVLGDNGSGSSLDVAAGIRYAADMGANVINLSLGGGYSSAIESAISYAQSVGSFIVAASGNEYASVPGFPAQFSGSYNNVLSVGAYDSSGRIASFSNGVGSSNAVQVDAPGVGVFSTYVGGRYASMSGTSMATPHVAGLAALTLSADPSISAATLRELLVSGVVGTSSGSDAIGNASTLSAVARAAAGNASGSSTVASTSSRGPTSGNGRGVGAAGVQQNQATQAFSKTETDSSDAIEVLTDVVFESVDKLSEAATVDKPSVVDDAIHALSALQDDAVDNVELDEFVALLA
ncbi:MAG: S8 family peptidase [Planctomycetota bacterium]